MTVEELINQLKQYDPKLPVLLAGYEGGVYEARGNAISEVTIAINVNDAWYYGPHEIVYDGINDDMYPGNQRQQGLYIR